jgi:hypothetical protein
MSVVGQLRSLAARPSMSVRLPAADIVTLHAQVRNVPHSITSSESAMTVAGISSPSALAVLMLMTN